MDTLSLRMSMQVLLQNVKDILSMRTSMIAMSTKGYMYGYMTRVAIVLN